MVNHIGTCRKRFLAVSSNIGMCGMRIKKPAAITTVIHTTTKYFQVFNGVTK